MLDLGPIRRRARQASLTTRPIGVYIGAVMASSDDVPALIAEVERLREGGATVSAFEGRTLMEVFADD